MVFEILSLEFKDFLFNFFIPFAIVFLISYGIFERMKIFNRRINLFLALGFTTLFASTALFTFFSSFIAQLGAFFAIASFVAIFILGAFFYYYKKGQEINLKPRLIELLRKKDLLEKELEKAVKSGDIEKVKKINEELGEVKKDIDALKKVMEK